MIVWRLVLIIAIDKTALQLLLLQGAMAPSFILPLADALTFPTFIQCSKMTYRVSDSYMDP